MKKSKVLKLIKKVSFKRWILYPLVILILLLVVTVLVFAINKDRISAYILKSTNNLVQGEVVFDDISMSPFIQFPSITLTFKNVDYFENKAIVRDSSIKPFISLNYVHVGINILALTKNNVVFNSIYLKDGYINLIKYSDSTLNVSNALKKVQNTQSIDKQDTTLSIDTLNHHKLSIYLNKIKCNNIEVSYDNNITNNKTSIKINTLTSNLALEKDSIFAEIELQIDAKKIPIAPFKKTTNVNISLNSSLCFNKQTKYLTLYESILSVSDADFNAMGSVDLDKGLIDVKIKGSDKKLGFVKLFLVSDRKWNIDSGEVDFEVAILGNFLHDTPNIQGKFGIINMNIFNPKTPFKIDDLSLLGSFNSGVGDKFTNAKFVIDTISAILPEGYLRGSFQLKNLRNPIVEYDIDLLTNIYGLNRVLKVKDIENMAGSISLQSSFKGSLKQLNNGLKNRESYINLELKKVAFNIPGKFYATDLNGVLTGNADTLCLSNLSALMGNSDVSVNGVVYNLSNLFSGSNEPFRADVQVASSLFDLVDFLNYTPNIGKGFPHQIHNLDADISFEATHNQLVSKSPGVQFTITNHRTQVSLNTLIPTVTLMDGIFTMGENLGARVLTFDNFGVLYGEGSIKTDVVIYSPNLSERVIDISARLTDFSTGKFIFYKSDSIAPVLDGILSGNLFSKLTINQDRKTLFSNVELTGTNLIYELDSGIIRAKDMYINTHNTHLNKLGNGKLSTMFSSDVNVLLKNVSTSKISFAEASTSFSFNYDTSIYLDNFTFNINTLNYKKDSTNLNVEYLGVNSKKSDFNLNEFKNPLASLNSDLSVKLKNLSTDKFKIEKVNYDINVLSGNYSINSLNSNIIGAGGNGHFFITPFKKPMQLQLQYSIHQFDTKEILKLFSNNEVIQGKLNLDINIGGTIASYDSIFSDLSGQINLWGDSLILNGIDIDEFLKKAERSQNYDLVDLGAFMVAGPFGLVVSRGTSMTTLLFNDSNAKSIIPQFKSNVILNNGVFKIDDMAFTTKQNRIAALGELNFDSKTLSVEVAVVDINGCSMLSQKISGPISKPKLSKLEIISSLFSPATNLYKDVFDKKCTPFYTGTVKHPELKK